ncbi:MAG TPA: CopG family transcriptional regulator [Archaeoglobus veneficus]|nr:CopG family transcriptional regulator [Archaeoglobus veneficus]
MESISLEIDNPLYEKILKMSNGDVEGFVKKAIDHYIENFKPVEIDYDSMLRVMARSSCMVNPASIITVKLSDEETKKIENLIGKSGINVYHFIKEAIKDYIYTLGE